MSSLKLVDPELRENLAAAPQFDLNETTLPIARRMVDELTAMSQQAAPATGETVHIPGKDGQPDVTGLLYRPEGAPTGRPGIFHVHGGGMVMCSPEINRERDLSLVEQHGCVVLSPAYRLAPEAKYPTALNDLWLAFTWFLDNAEALGVDREKIIVLGESAGGGLAAALVLLARDRKAQPLLGQILVYPMIDDRTGSIRAPEPNAGEFVWTAEMNRFGWTCLLPMAPGSDDVPYLAAPARATDFTDLPPTFIQVGALDLFVHENIDFARRLLLAGVPTGLRIYPNAYHAFDLVPDAEVTRMCQADFHQCVRKFIAG